MNSNRVFFTECADSGAVVDIMPESSKNGIDIYRVSIRFAEKKMPPKVKISWEEDMVGILHVWHPLCGTGHSMHQWFGPTVSNSCFHFGAPMLCTIGDCGVNSSTVAVSDAETPICIDFCIKDLDQKFKVGYSVTFFKDPSDEIQTYEALIRIDGRSLPFYETVKSVYPWWKSLGYVIPEIPKAAEDPLYSSWYNFHQAPKDTALIEDLRIAADLGFRTVILDDGWQFHGPSSGDYSMCGEWQVADDKFSDFKAFTDEVHRLGMKLMVWFAVPFIGVDSPLFERFEGKYVYVQRGIMNEGTLDPRYPEVREFIIGNYKRFLTEYGIDGFKFDFIDSFGGWGDEPKYDPEKMDCETVSGAVNLLMTEIVEELGAIKPDLLYEYRQNYVGPAINRFGNMLRVGDCAYESHTNRVGTVDLRLLNYPVAVHSDMLYWAKGESLKLCARQLLNILFSVPQISVILGESTEEQKKLVKDYLDYWMENRDIILHGDFKAIYPEQNYTVISSETENKRISVHHGDIPYVFDGKSCDLFHNGDVDGVIVENSTDSTVSVEIYELFGKEPVSVVTLEPCGIQRISVPQTGMIRISIKK